MNTQEIKFNYDDLNDEKVFIEGERIAFLKIQYDEHADNPLTEWDGEGRIYSFNSRHVNYIGNDAEEKIARLLRCDEAVVLDYSEHGNCLWSVQGGQHMDRFDSVSGAGLWVPDAEAKAAAPNDDTRKAWMIQRAKGACEVYTDWCNGNVFAYRLEAYPLTRDEHGNAIESKDHYESNLDPMYEDFVGGYFGDDVYEEAAHALKQALDN